MTILAYPSTTVTGINRDMTRRRQILIKPIVTRRIFVIMLRNEMAAVDLPIRELFLESWGQHLSSGLWWCASERVTVRTGAGLDRRDTAVTGSLHYRG